MTRVTILAAGLIFSIGSLNALTQEKFQPKLHMQISKELTVDKLREQNLQVVQKAVEGIREALPQKVDAFTQIVGIDSNGTKLIYTFEVQSGSQSDEMMMQKGKKMAPRIQKGICLSSKRFLEADISIRYRYVSSRSKKEVLIVDVNKSSCNGE